MYIFPADICVIIHYMAAFARDDVAINKYLSSDVISLSILILGLILYTQWSLPKRTLREADNSLQRTEAMSPTYPLFGGSTVQEFYFLDSRTKLCSN